MVTNQQVLLLRRRIMQGKSQQASAAAGMNARSARRWRSGPLPSEKKRSWLTRPDAFVRSLESPRWHVFAPPLTRNLGQGRRWSGVTTWRCDAQTEGRQKGRDFNERYKKILDHQGMKATRTNLYSAHEKGVPSRETGAYIKDIIEKA